MANIIIPYQHQSAPALRYDPVLAREAAAAKNRHDASRQDWDAIDWEAANPILARRRRMTNADFDQEFDRPAHHDPDMQLLEQRAFREWVERRPEAWVEETLELHESNRAKAKNLQLAGQERWEGKQNQDTRMVNILHPTGVLRKLRAAGVDARNEEHPNARIWLNDWTCQGMVGVNSWVRPQEMDAEGYLVALQSATSQTQKDLITDNYAACRGGRKVRKTLTSLQEPYGPEWSVMRFSAHGVATKEKYRGWRTAMLVLIVAEILTAEEVDAAFGPPIGEAGAWYRSQLQAWRQIKLGKAI
jgi:hypothetical protein